MQKKKPSKTSFPYDGFPYRAFWEEHGGDWVSFEYIEIHADHYRSFIEMSDLIGLKLPNPTPADFEELVTGLELSKPKASQLVEEIWIVSCWYLTPLRQKAMRYDLDTIKGALEKLVRVGREMSELSGEFSGGVSALIDLVRRDEPEAYDMIGPNIDDVGRASHDLSVVAERMLDDLRPRKGGRRAEYWRDNAIKLVIEIAQRAGLDDLKTSRGTNARPEPHLKGKVGDLLKGFFEVVAPNIHERTLVEPTERVRRQTKR